MPRAVVRAVAAALLALDYQKTAVLSLVMYHAMLRPGEAGAMLRQHVLLPRDGHLAPGVAIVTIARPKTRFRGARVQSVIIDDPTLVELMQCMFGDLSGRATLCPGGVAGLRARLAAAFSRVGIGQGPYSLGSYRAGGATDMFAEHCNLAAVQYRGRWDNPRTLAHYLQMSTAALTYARLPGETVQLISTLSDLLDPLARGLLQSLRTANARWWWRGTG